MTCTEFGILVSWQHKSLWKEGTNAELPYSVFCILLCKSIDWFLYDSYLVIVPSKCELLRGNIRRCEKCIYSNSQISVANKEFYVLHWWYWDGYKKIILMEP